MPEQTSARQTSARADKCQTDKCHALALVLLALVQGETCLLTTCAMFQLKQTQSSGGGKKLLMSAGRMNRV